MKTHVATLAMAVFAVVVLQGQVGDSRNTTGKDAPGKGRIIIGSINGRSITGREPAAARESARKIFTTLRGHEPTSLPEQKEVDLNARNTECGHLRTQIDRAARDEAVRELGVMITEEDIAAARKFYGPFDPVAHARGLQQYSAALNAALSAVDQGRSPDEVYETMVKPHGVSSQEWTIHVRQRNNPAARERLARQQTVTADQLKQSYEGPERWRFAAEQEKLDQEVDKRIAAGDPQFAASLKSPDKTRVKFDPYMSQKRREWWRNQVAKLHVVLNDPAMVNTCGLDGLGMKAQ